MSLLYISRLYCAFSNNFFLLNIDKYFVCESRDMSDESGTYIILLKLKTILFTCHKKRVLLRKYQLMQPTYISNIGLYHAMYSRYVFMSHRGYHLISKTNVLSIGHAYSYYFVIFNFHSNIYQVDELI
jgi:hypothetical protein